VLIAVGAVLIVVVGSVAWLLFGGESPHPVTVEDAHERTDGSTVSTAPTGEFGPPAGGVYLYRGDGTEKTSIPPLTEREGPSMPATVTADGEGCWRFRIDYNSHHWQDWRFCADPSGIVTTGGRTFARRDFGTFNVDNTSTFVAAEPDVLLWKGMRVGESRPGHSTGTSTAISGSTTSAGTTTYIGDEGIEVAGQTIQTRHLRLDRQLSGAQDGIETVDWWVDPSTMLPIRNERAISVRTKVGALTVSYSEIATYELTSLSPK
jgi:hypothetical protein